MFSSASESGSVYNGEGGASPGPAQDGFRPMSPLVGTKEEYAREEKRRRELVVEESLMRLEAASMTKTSSMTSQPKASPRMKPASGVPECKSHLTRALAQAWSWSSVAADQVG